MLPARWGLTIVILPNVKLTFTTNYFESSTEAAGTSSWRIGCLWFQLQSNNITLGRVASSLWRFCRFNGTNRWATVPPIANVNRIISLEVCFKKINLEFFVLRNNKSPLTLLRIRESLSKKLRRNELCYIFVVIQAVSVEATWEKHESQHIIYPYLCQVF